MKKTFVLDTNVILFDPLAINKFGDNTVNIPFVVVEEIDRFKKDQNENGRNARHFSRIVDEYRHEGSLPTGVKLENGGTFIISVTQKPKERKDSPLNLDINDNLILAHALSLQDQGQKVIIVSKDINLRLKADVLGVDAEDYGEKNVTLDTLYSGCLTLKADGTALEDFEKNHFIDGAKLGGKLFPNQYFIVQDGDNDRRRIYGRYSAEKGGLIPLIPFREGVWGIYPKNMEQHFALDALLNDDINLVTLVGKAGTGKTLLAIAAGLETTISKRRYSRLLVSRPIQPMGRDLGFLPGDVNEKLGPWMQPIFDNMDFLFGQYGRQGSNTSYEDLINHGLLHIEPLTYIRGRSIPKQYLIVDESQNLSPHEVKTIITRAGEGTKIVLTGDCQQIDSPYLDEVNNGLAYCVERLKSESIVAHTTLTIGERSPLSEAASRHL